jgi:hypothetical protein
VWYAIVMKQTITIIDENFEEKSLELTYAQLQELNRWLNIYLNTGRTLEYKLDKRTKKVIDVKLAQM